MINNVRIGEKFFYKMDDGEWIIFQITRTSIGYGHRYYHWKVLRSHTHRSWDRDDQYNWIASTFNNRDVVRITDLNEEEISQLIFSELV